MEVEAKFRAPDAGLLDRLGDITELAGYPIFAGRTEQLRDTYTDTERWQILSAGYTCRRREVDDRILITVKQVRAADDQIHRREELEVDLAADVPPSEWPDSEARAKILEIVGHEPLVDQLSLVQDRSTRWVGTLDRPVAEMSLDEVHLQPSGNVYHEVELELMEAGSEDDLAVLITALREDWQLQPEPRSKFERALEISRSHTDLEQHPGDTGAQPAEAEGAHVAGRDENQTEEAPSEEPEDASPDSAPPPSKHVPEEAHHEAFLGDGLEVLTKPGIEVDDSMSTAANKLLLFHLQRMMKHEPGTREGEDPEELHDMRVATRRMRAALRVFSEYLNAPQYKPYLKLVRSTGRELGAVRDLDVFKIKTERYINTLLPGGRAGLDPLMEAWAEERERARAELIDYLDSSRYQCRKEEFEHFLRTPGAGAGPSLGATGEPLPHRVGDVLPAILFDRLASVRAFDQVITQPDAPLARFHELRIASKGLRYTLEFFQEVLGPGSKPLIETMKAVQDHLGDLQDAVVTCDVLLGFLGSGTWGATRSTGREARRLHPVNAPGVAGYLAAKQSEIETLMGTFGPVWERIRSHEFTRPLAELVGAL